MSRLLETTIARSHRMFARVRRALHRFESERSERADAGGAEVTAKWHFEVTIEPDPLDGGFIAYIADLPGVMSQGDTETEALRNLSDAFAEVLYTRLEQATPVDDQPRLFPLPEVSVPVEHRRPAVAICR